MSLMHFSIFPSSSYRAFSNRLVVAATARHAPPGLLLRGSFLKGVILTSALLTNVLLSASAYSEDAAMQSDWLQLVKGHKGSTMGAELMQIKEGDTPDMQTIMLAIPKSEGVDRAAMEEVMVVGQMPEQIEPLEFTYEWLEDYDNDRYGLVIHLRKDNNWPIRLHFNAAGGFATDATSPGEATP